VRHEASCYVGGLDEKVTDSILWELFIQAGPVRSVYLSKDRLTNMHQGYAFVEMQTEEDADYALNILNMIKLYGKPIRVSKASAHQKDVDVGAKLFIGNLDPNVDEKTLFDIFSAFGVIMSPPKIMKDQSTNVSKGFAFINFATFDASDAAIEAMNGQFIENRPITIQYAFKKEAKGERHGSIAERLLAAKNPNTSSQSAINPNKFFAENPAGAAPTSLENTEAMPNHQMMFNPLMNPNPLMMFGMPPPMPVFGAPGQMFIPADLPQAPPSAAPIQDSNGLNLPPPPSSFYEQQQGQSTALPNDNHQQPIYNPNHQEYANMNDMQPNNINQMPVPPPALGFPSNQATEQSTNITENGNLNSNTLPPPPAPHH